jgi:hypothetical protein
VVGDVDRVRTQLRRRTFPHRAALVACAVLGVLAGCDRASVPAHAAQATGEGGAPFSIDSALTLFRSGLPRIDELAHAQTSIDATVTRFVAMVERSDTAAMRSMVMSRREFAWLYYPTSAFTRKPMLQEPGLVWFLHLNNSQKGATRLLDRYGSRRLNLVSNVCKDPRSEGENRVWYDCMQRIVEGTDTVSVRLFGGILERHGRFKIFSYSNDL